MLGYIGIVFENFFEFNKAALSLLMCTALWIVYGDSLNSTPEVLHMLSEKVAEVSEVVFFILGKIISVICYNICCIHGIIMLFISKHGLVYTIYMQSFPYFFAMLTLHYISYLYTLTPLIYRRDDDRGDSGRASRVQGGD